MKAVLEISNGPQRGKKHELGHLGSFTIGRGGESDLKVPDHAISRHHCRIDYEGEYYWLVDCNSHNGTFLNGQKVANSMLYDGDVISVGHTEMVFRLPQEELDDML